MWKTLTKGAYVIDFPYENEFIPAGSKVWVLGTETEEKTICIRYQGRTRMIKSECLK